MQPDPVPSPQARRPRWWPALLVLGAAAFALLAVHLSDTADRQRRIVLTAAVALIAFVLLLLWLLLFSRLSARMRIGALAALVGVALGIAALVDVRGLSGDLVPILEWRWNRSTAQLEAGDVGPAGLDLAALSFPQFLGAGRDGQVDVALDPDWESRGPELLWRRPVGAGWSGFAIGGGLAVTLEQDGPREAVRAYAVATGQPVWEHEVDARYEDALGGPGPRSTPSIDGDAVYAYGATGILRALALSDGRERWRRDVPADSGGSVPEYGVAASPLVFEGRVVVAAGGRDGNSLVAYDTRTGAPVWGGGEAPAAYSSPMLARFRGHTSILWLHQHGVSAHDPVDGHVLWTVPWPGGTQKVAQPVLVPGDRFFVTTGYGIGGVLFRFGVDDAPERQWASLALKSKFADVVLREGFLFGLDDGILVCVDVQTGERRWKRGRYGHGQILLAGRHLLVVAENGDLALVEATPDEFRERARIPALDGKTWNPPALAGPLLIVRNDREAAAFRLTLEAGPPMTPAGLDPAGS